MFYIAITFILSKGGGGNELSHFFGPVQSNIWPHGALRAFLDSIQTIQGSIGSLGYGAMPPRPSGTSKQAIGALRAERKPKIQSVNRKWG